MGKIKDALLPLQHGDSGYIELHGEDFFFLYATSMYGNSVKVTHEGQKVTRNYIMDPVATRADIARAVEEDWAFWFGGSLNVWGQASQGQTYIAGGAGGGVNLMDKPHSTIDPYYSEEPVEGEKWLDENGWLKPKYERLLQKQEPWKR